MANKLYEESAILDIATAIREKNSTSAKYTVSQMGDAVRAIQTGAESIEKTYSQRNTVAGQFIDNVVYSPSDYTVSSIATYANQSTDYAKSKPFGCTLNLPAGELIIVDNSNGGTFSEMITEGEHTIYNITPTAEGGEFIVVNNGKVVLTGHLIPTGALRMIYNEAELFRNCRDLGGWNCDGGTIKYGLLFRGNEPYGKITDNDKAMWNNLIKLKKEINLQSATEIGDRTESGFGASVDMFCIDMTYGTLEDWKTSGKSNTVFNELFDYVIDRKPTFFHCTAGADRTGYITLIIDAILGVSQSDIDKEYELTCFSTGADTDGNARRRNEVDWTSRINYINTFDGNTFRDKAVNYLVQCGISIDKINAFRIVMIDGNPETLTVDVQTFTVTKSLSNSIINNNSSTISEYQPFNAEIIPNAGYVIDDITVTMGGVDITDEVVKGTYISLGTMEINENGEYDVTNYDRVNVNVEIGEIITRHTVTQTLNGATTNNSQTEIINGQSYGAVISAPDGKVIETISVTIDGGQISSDFLIYEEV